MPAPNMGADTSSMPNNGMHQPSYAAAQPQMPTQPVTAPVPNMNMCGSAPVLNQPGITAPQAPVAVAQKEGRNTLVETIILVVVCLIAASAIVAAVIFFMKYNDVSEDMKPKRSLKSKRLRQRRLRRQRRSRAKNSAVQPITVRLALDIQKIGAFMSTRTVRATVISWLISIRVRCRRSARLPRATR